MTEKKACQTKINRINKIFVIGCVAQVVRALR